MNKKIHSNNKLINKFHKSKNIREFKEEIQWTIKRHCRN